VLKYAIGKPGIILSSRKWFAVVGAFAVAASIFGLYVLWLPSVSISSLGKTKSSHLNISLFARSYYDGVLNGDTPDAPFEHAEGSANPICAPLYPQKLFDEKGNAILGSRGAIEYSLTNPLGRSIIVEINQSGLFCNEDPSSTNYAQSVNIRLYTLKSRFFLKTGKSSLPVLMEEKLFSEGFIPYDLLSGKSFYDFSVAVFKRDDSGAFRSSADICLSLDVSVDLDDGVKMLSPEVSGKKGGKTHLRMPPCSSAKFIYSFTPKAASSRRDRSLNPKLSYSVITLDVSDDPIDKNGNFIPATLRARSMGIIADEELNGPKK
jgi:hypothetical protein